MNSSIARRTKDDTMFGLERRSRKGMRIERRRKEEIDLITAPQYLQ